MVPNTPEWRTKYEQVVSSATKWADTLKILEIADDPNTTPSDRIKSVVGGYKSRETDLSNKLNEKSIEVSKATQEITNRVEQVGRLEKDLLEKDKYYKALIDALNKQLKHGSDALPLAQARIGVLEDQLDEASKAKDKALNDAQEAKSQLDACQKGTLVPTPQLIFSLVVQYLSNKLPKGGEKL